MSAESRVVVEISHINNFEFNVKFDLDGVQDLLLDEPEPLGKQKGPNASRLLIAAVGNCLSASLIMCLNKARIDPAGMKTIATASMVRDESNRLRIGDIAVKIDIAEIGSAGGRLDRCFDLFEQFCVVTASVRQGIPVNVSVDIAGKTVFTDAGR